MTQHLIIPEILVFSKRTWQTLSKEDQDLIMKEAKAAQTEQWKLWDEFEEKSIADMKANGVEIIKVDNAGDGGCRQEVGLREARQGAAADDRAHPGREVMTKTGDAKPAGLSKDRAGFVVWGAGMKAQYIRLMDVLHRFCMVVAGFCLVAITLMIPYGVFTRYVLNSAVVVAGADGGAADDLVLVPVGLAGLSREPAYRRRRHPDDARRARRRPRSAG